jgi:hypothetical protein
MRCCVRMCWDEGWPGAAAAAPAGAALSFVVANDVSTWQAAVQVTLHELQPHAAVQGSDVSPSRLQQLLCRAAGEAQE